MANLAEAVAIDPNGYETATCKHCEQPIARRVYLPETGWRPGLWRHLVSVNANSVYCDSGNTTGAPSWA